MSRIAILSLTVAGILGVGVLLHTRSTPRPGKHNPSPVALDVAPEIRTEAESGGEPSARETLLRQAREGSGEQAEWALIALMGDDSPEMKDLLFFLVEHRAGRVQEGALANLVEILESLDFAERERARADARTLIRPGLPTGTRLEAMELLLTGPDVRQGDVDMVLGLLGGSDQPEVKLQAIRLLAENDEEDPALRARLAHLAADPSERPMVREIAGVLARAKTFRSGGVAREIENVLGRVGNP